MKTLFILLFSLVFFFGTDVLAGIYISEEVPPDSLIARHLCSYSGEKLIGKFKHSDDNYTIYYYAKSGSKFLIKSLPLVGLDTNKWVIRMRNGDLKVIMEP